MGFGAAMSVDWLERAGLGRGGEALDPWGDLAAMARARCLLRPGARMLAAVPVARSDGMIYNAFRCYGPRVLPHLLADWRPIWSSHPFLREGVARNCTEKTYATFLLEKPG